MLSCSFAGWSQQKGSYFSAMAFQEFDLFSKNQPFGIALTTKLGRLFLQGDYRHSASPTTQYQVLSPRDSYGAKIGYIGGGLGAEGGTCAGFTVGIQIIEAYKRLTYEVNEMPVDINGETVEINKIQIPLEYTQFSLGFQLLSIQVGDKGKMDSFIDDFDLKLNKNKVRYSTVQMSIEMLYSPKISHSNTFAYSPYGYYIPRDFTLASAPKEKHFGVKMRMEYTTPMKIGLIVDMGVFPGIAHKTNGYNDFNFGVKFGALVNLSVFTKNNAK